MRIVVICPYPPDLAPGQRLKFEQYYESWRRAGHEVEVLPFWSSEAWGHLYAPGARLRKVAALLAGFGRRVADLPAALRADVVYLFLEATPLGPPVLERIIDRRGVPILYDIDDLVYLPHSSTSNAFMRRLRSPDKVPELMRRAKHVVVCTDHLRRFALNHNDRVTSISSTIDLDAYEVRPHRPTTDGVVVGWSGSHSTSPYLHFLDRVLRDLQSELGIAIKVIGDAAFRIEGARVHPQAWKLSSEVGDLSEIDIGVYPLPDEEWVLGKSGLKALQYMALGIPTIAQRVGTNLEIIDHGRNGFLASTPAEWHELLTTLVLDPDLRQRIGLAGRRTVEERYSVSVNKPHYLAILEEVATKRHPPAGGPRPNAFRDRARSGWTNT